MKINELLAKINTVVFYVLSAPEYITMILAEKSENGDKIKVKTFFLEITKTLESLFLENTNFWKFLPQAPEFEYPSLIMKINIFRDYCNAALELKYLPTPNLSQRYTLGKF